MGIIPYIFCYVHVFYLFIEKKEVPFSAPHHPVAVMRLFCAADTGVKGGAKWKGNAVEKNYCHRRPNMAAIATRCFCQQ
jgi:hypothetical protein